MEDLEFLDNYSDCDDNKTTDFAKDEKEEPEIMTVKKVLDVLKVTGRLDLTCLAFGKWI